MKRKTLYLPQNPPEREVVTLHLQAKDLASFIEAQQAWVAESGKYTVKVGRSSQDILQQAEFTLDDALIVEKVHKAFEK